MAEDDQDQRTEEATSKRLEEAREKGRIPISREVVNWSLFAGILIMIAYLMPTMAKRLVYALRVFLEKPHDINLEGHGSQVAMANLMAELGLSTVQIFSLLIFAAIIGTMVQTGFFMNTEKLKPDFSKISPAQGFKRLFSMNAVSEFLKSFFKLVVIGFVAYKLLIPILEAAPFYMGEDILASMVHLHEETVHIIIVLMSILTVIAVADLAYQRYEFFKSLRMTKQEVKDEYKQMEGDPLIKGRLRQIRLEKARRRMMAKVPNADVVITNPTHFAVALEYNKDKSAAPVVIAKGADKVAARIRAMAEEHDVPLVQNPPLARALYDTTELDDIIAPEHYRAVAEVISYVYKLKKEKAKWE